MAGPPASMRAKGSTSSGTSGNRSPPNYRGRVDQAPGAMRAWEPNTEMANARVRTPPKGMTSVGDAAQDRPRINPDSRPYRDRKVPAGYNPRGS